MAFCRENNIPLAYDTAQIGWVLASAQDDIIDGLPPAKAGWENDIAAPKHEKPRFNARDPEYKYRAWNDADVDVFRALLDDPDVWTWLPEDYPAPLTVDVAASLIELSNASTHHKVRAILRNNDIVGQVRLQYEVVPQDHAIAEISYWLGRAHWGKGIASHVVRDFTAICFETHPQLSAIIARVHKDNVASQRVLEKAGYDIDGADPKDADWNILRSVRV